ncbi:hypothetical protein V2W45_1441463 [Cenococcum geophilum]
MPTPSSPLTYMNMTPDIPVTYNRLKYTCRGQGLEGYGHRFVADLTPHLPTLFKNGKVKKGETNRRQQYEPNWWKAQCTFRGLSEKGKLPELQDRLRKGPNVMLPELVELEKRVNSEWMVKDEALRLQEEREAEIQYQKEVDEATDILKKAFHDEKSGSDIIRIKNRWSEVWDAAESLKLTCAAFRSPHRVYWKDYDCLVVGRSKASVDTELAILRKEFNDDVEAKEREEEAKEKEKEAERDATARAVAIMSEKGGMWDVTGTWKISCPEIDRQYNTERKDMALQIYRINTQTSSQMFAKFDFAIIEGWFRFEGSAMSKASRKKKGALIGQKLKRIDYEYEHESDTDSDEEEINEAFYLSPNDRPSTKQPTFNYRWRGRETGEGEIEVGSDKNSTSITFSGQGGAKLSGTIECEYVQGCKFTGVKMEMGDPREASRVKIEEEWRELNERAYDRECTRRWGGW